MDPDTQLCNSKVELIIEYYYQHKTLKLYLLANRMHQLNTRNLIWLQLMMLFFHRKGVLIATIATSIAIKQTLHFSYISHCSLFTALTSYQRREEGVVPTEEEVHGC